MTPPYFTVPPWAQPRSCYSVLSGGPEEEPITVAEAKLRAGLDWPASDPREQLVPKLIAAARSMVERETGLALLTQTRDVYFWPYDPTQGVPLPAQCTPLQEITLLEPWEPTLAPGVQSGWAGPFFGSVSPARPRVQIGEMLEGAGAHMTLVAGWPSAELLQVDAPLLVQAVGLLVGHMLTLGRDLAITGAMAISSTPQGYEDCIAPHRLMWVA